MNVLVIDDENSIQSFLKVSLESAGYAVVQAKSGNEGLQLLSSRNDIAVALLDFGLPDIHGIDLLKKLRSLEIKVPVIALTVMDDDAMKVRALDLGADDYITKPFSIAELLARIRVAIRHSGKQSGEANYIRTGNLEIDVLAHVVKVKGVEVKLTPLEFQILSLLGRNLGKVVTHRILLNKVWGPNSIEHVQYLRVHLGQVRKKLKAHGVEELLVTESGVGYRLLSV